MYRSTKNGNPSTLRMSFSFTYCILGTPYVDIDLSQYWLWQCLVGWWHQGYKWKGTDLSTVMSPGIHRSKSSCDELQDTTQENKIEIRDQWVKNTLGSIIQSDENSSTVDPQWDIMYRGSKWNLHTVCWDAVGCEWGTTSVYFGITYVCFIPSRLPVFVVEPQYQHRDFLFLSKLSIKGHTQNLHVCLKFEWGL